MMHTTGAQVLSNKNHTCTVQAESWKPLNGFPEVKMPSSHARTTAIPMAALRDRVLEPTLVAKALATSAQQT